MKIYKNQNFYFYLLTSLIRNGISNKPAIIANIPQYKNKYFSTWGTTSWLIAANIAPYPIITLTTVAVAYFLSNK